MTVLYLGNFYFVVKLNPKETQKMAKKKVASSSEPAKAESTAKKEAPKKLCPKCKVSIPTGKASHDCGWKRKPTTPKEAKASKSAKKAKKERKLKTPPQAPASFDYSKIKTAIDLIKKLGGLEQAESKLATVEELQKLI